MDEDKQHIVDFAHRFMQAAGKYAQVEMLPIRVDDEHEVTTREAHVIEAIGNASVINVTMLSSHFAVTRSAASQMVSKLINRGFVRKEFAPSSAKEYRLFLTDLGCKAYDAHDHLHGQERKALFEKLASFAPSELAVLSSVFEALTSVMDVRLQNHK